MDLEMECRRYRAELFPSEFAHISHQAGNQGQGSHLVIADGYSCLGLWLSKDRNRNMEHKGVIADLKAVGLAGNPTGRSLGLGKLTWLALAAAGLQGCQRSCVQGNVIL